MPRIRKHIEIQAPRDQVFALAADPSQQPEWVIFLEEVEVTSGDGKSAGTKDRHVMKMGLRSQQIEAEWTEYKEPEAFASTATSGMSIEHRMSFSPIEQGTRVDWVIRYKPPLGPIGLLVDLLFMNRVFQNEVEDSLDCLKAQLED